MGRKLVQKQLSETSRERKSNTKSIANLQVSKSYQQADNTMQKRQNVKNHRYVQRLGIVKRQLWYRRTRYRGLKKQTSKLNIMFALANLILADRKTLAV